MPKASNLYSTNVTFGDQSFELLVDTGSSDTWVNTTSAPKLFQEIPDTLLILNYGGQTVPEALGTYGKMVVTLGSITIKDQVVGIANQSIHFNGILGLSYPGFVGMRSSSNGSHLDYDPIFTRMINDKSISSGILSLALNADSTGQMGFGGIPSGIKHENNWFHTPLLSGHERATRFGVSPWYNISMSYSFPGSENVIGGQGLPNNTFFAIVDSGTSTDIIPFGVMQALSQAFDPPATIQTSDPSTSLLTFECNAKVPDLGYVIGGYTFQWKKEDWTSQVNGVCSSKFIGSSLEWPSPGAILSGGEFLQKVLAVFDVEHSDMWFALRV